MSTTLTTVMQDEVKALARERDAVILAHNYQVPEVQDVADYVGDSLGLSREAAATDAEAIVFCGVHFMAETAAILSPDKTVLIPDLDAGCSLAASITADQLREWKADNPDAVVVSYVNTTAEVKAETDYCCTSGNARAVIEAIPADRDILFLPDMYLGIWLERVTGRKLNIWMGECHVHAGIRPADIERWQDEAPDAELLVHPECGCASQCMAFGNGRTHILSTEGMINFAKESPKSRFLVATETGIIHRLEQGGSRQALRGRVRAGHLQVHEDDHARQAARLAARLEARRDRRARDRRTRPGRDRADGRHQLAPKRAAPLGGPSQTTLSSLVRVDADVVERDRAGRVRVHLHEGDPEVACHRSGYEPAIRRVSITSSGGKSDSRLAIASCRSPIPTSAKSTVVGCDPRADVTSMERHWFWSSAPDSSKRRPTDGARRKVTVDSLQEPRAARSWNPSPLAVSE